MLGLQGAVGSTPVGGRSRYSKALPSVPIANRNHPDLPPLPQHISDFQFPLPPAPPSHENDDVKSIKSVKSIARKPVGSSTPKSTPPLPETPSVSSPPLLNSTSTGSMAIPRKAVGRTLQPSAQPTPAAPEPSPRDSIFSLLAAYSEEPELPMADGTYSTANTTDVRHDSNVGPSLDGDRPPAGDASHSQAPMSAVKANQTSEQKDRDPPAPPPKADSARSTTSPLKTLPLEPMSGISSPPRPEIWKRRPQTAEKNKELPELHLNYSHGSTASSSSIQSVKTAVLKASSGTGSSTSTDKPAESSAARPPVVGLPGRNIRPASKEKIEETAKAMGSTSSKVQGMRNALDGVRTAVDRKDLPVRRDSKRPPTPEYRKGDVGPPSAQVDTIAKPESPISATGSPKEGVLSDSSKPFLPPPTASVLAEAKAPSPAFAPSPASIPTRTSAQAAPDLRLAKSFQELGRGNSAQPRDASPPSTKAQFPPRKDSKRAASGFSDSAPSRISSGQQSTGAGAVDHRRPGTANGSSDPRIVFSDAQGPMYRGRDGTLYPEMKVSAEFDPRAAYFPVQADRTLGPGTIIPSKPLNQSHYNCFQKHRTMNRRSNRNYPLTCQTCDKADTEDRWVCTFCHLRICETCSRGLNGHQKVLGSLVDQIRTSTPLSLSSESRPGSALGIKVPA